MGSRARPSAALATTVVLWASAFPAIRVGLDGLGVAGLSCVRLAVASVALAAAAPVIGIRRPGRAELGPVVLCGATGMTAYQLLLNWGEVHVPAGTASLLIASAPVWSVLLAAAFLGERITARIAAGSAVAFAGVALIALATGPASLSAGAPVVVAAAIVQGAYHAATKPLLRRHTGLEVACYSMWAGTALSLPLAPFAVHGVRSAPGSALAAAVYLGLLPSAVGFVAWGHAVARHALATATAALYLVPPVALVAAFVWLGERPRPAALLGGVVTIAGVVVINRRSAST